MPHFLATMTTGTTQPTRKALPKPTLKRSMDLGYETLVEMDSVTAADIAADPPLLDVDDATFTSSTSHDSFYQLSLNTMDEPAVSALGSAAKQENLNVVEVESSASKTQNQPVGGNDDDDLDGIHRFDDDIRRVYSTDKPVNFSLQASPVKKQDNTFNETLDCSFDVPLLKSIDVEKSMVAPQDSTWTSFANEPFQKSVEVSLSSSGRGQGDDDDDDAFEFAASVFEGLESIATAGVGAPKISIDTNAVHTLIGQMESLTSRLERIERIVLSNNTVQVSESSDESPHNRAFIIENTELLLEISAVNEDITINDNNWGEDKSKGSKFSLKRMMRSQRFGGKSKTKHHSLVEV